MIDTGSNGDLSCPARTVEAFQHIYEQNPKAATNWYYQLSRRNGWIHPYHSKGDTWWGAETEYGNLEITFNAENEDGADWLRHPVNHNVTVIPLIIDHAPRFLEYVPYAYCEEQCICVSYLHSPISLDQFGFKQLLDFVRQFPHYFAGLDADLSISGSRSGPHDYFQTGRCVNALDRAPVEKAMPYFESRDVDVGVVKWPMSVVRIASQSPERLAATADRILRAWRGYTDTTAMIYAKTDGIPHNTAMTIARKRDVKYELDLVLRSNLTTDDHPLGLFHPHEELHHIKKGNIGLIEAMGLAALPAHLKAELNAVARGLAQGRDLRKSRTSALHAEWADGFRDRYRITPENALEIVQKETGAAFVKALEDAGVFKRDESGRTAFLRFLEYVRRPL